MEPAHVSFVDATPANVTSPSSSKMSPLLSDLNSRLLASGLIQRPLKFTSLLSALFDSSEGQSQETPQYDGNGKKIRRESVERELENLCKALSGLESQRKDDLLQIESLSTARQVIVYDHERMKGMYTKLKTRLTTLEKDRENLKSQVVALSSKVARQETLLRTSREEASRSRNALAGLRTQYGHELKKKEVQMERIMAGWQRLSNESARGASWNPHLGGQGLLLLNPVKETASGPKADTFWDPSISDLNHTIENLREECDAFRHVTLSTANQLQTTLSMISNEPEPDRILSSVFFTVPSGVSSSSSPLSNSSQVSSSISHPKAADIRLRDIMNRLRLRVETTNEERSEAARDRENWRKDLDGLLEGERVQRVKDVLEGRIKEMERQLEIAHRSPNDYQHEVQESSRSGGEDIQSRQREMEAQQSAELEALESQRKALEHERRQFAEVMIRLGNEKAIFEAEKATFKDTARARELDHVLREQEWERKIEAAKQVTPPPVSEQTEDDNREINDEPIIKSVSPIKQRLPLTSAHRVTSPRRVPSANSRSRPTVSSPLRSNAGSGARPKEEARKDGRPHLSPAIARKRSRKGPATPLARYVTHKIVAEKLASVRGQEDAKAEQEEQAAPDGNVQSRKPSATALPSSDRPAPLGSTGTMANKGKQPLSMTSRLGRSADPKDLKSSSSSSSSMGRPAVRPAAIRIRTPPVSLSSSASTDRQTFIRPIPGNRL